MIICITLQAKLDSRSCTLLDFLKNKKGHNIKLIICKNRFLLIRLLSIIFNLLMIMIMNLKYKEEGRKIYFLFNNHLIYPIALLIHNLNIIKVIVDLGYSFKEHTSYKKEFIKKIYLFIENQIIQAKGLNILLESDQQVKLYKKRFFKANFYKFYMINSFGINFQGKLDTNSISLKDKKFLKYINYPFLLFRGRLNKESGILNIIEQFDNFTKSSNKKKA